MLHPTTLLALVSVLFLHPGRYAAAGENATKTARSSPTESTPDWQLRDSNSFVIHFLSGDEDFAQNIADGAERTRVDLYRNWFGVEAPMDWNPKCHVYLHAVLATYSAATENRASSSGYSVTHSSRGRVISQRVDLLKDGSDTLHAVMPHELAHVLLSNYFVRRALPLWAEEGLAVLAETPEIRNAHMRNLDMYARRGTLFATRDIMGMREYPAGDQRGVFYAQSVSLVEFLISRRGTPQFMEFLALTARQGSEAVLKQVYGVTSLQELHQDWMASTISVNKLGMTR